MISFLRAFLVGIVVWLVGRALARAAMGGSAGRRPDGRGARAAPGAGRPERLVHDPVCGVRLPESRALRLSTADGPRFFCSEGCRAAFAGEPAAAD